MNGRGFSIVNQLEISFQQLIQRLYPNSPSNINFVASYVTKDGKITGNLRIGESVKISDKMAFIVNVCKD